MKNNVLFLYILEKSTLGEVMTNSTSWLVKGYKSLVIGEKALGSFILLVIRLYWGWLLFFTGLGKWMHIGSVGGYFASLNISAPYFFAGLVATIELVGGISLFFGLWARLFTIPLVINFIVAYSTANIAATKNIFLMPGEFIKQEPFLYLYASLIVLCFGSGFFSFDYWIEKKIYGKPL
jgi:putative oxidoreductase